ncbi:MAG: hypothetical protein N4A49_09610 [Marinifilaceae bacterium]|jgi:hypothetical protein|nr:hypothetical protein [Marinifilaceae bacterium]
MEEAINFIKSFFEVEAEVRFKNFSAEKDYFNKQLEKMNSFCARELHSKFGMVALKPEDEIMQDTSYPNLRQLFKISLYTNPIYGDMFLAYCSDHNPDNDYLEYWDCFLVTKIEGNLRIIKRFYFDDDLDTTSTEKFWKESHGVKDINFSNLGEFKNSIRIKEPIDCEYFTKDYLQNK